MAADPLDQRILAAHANGDQCALVDLYTEAAAQADTVDTRCFFLTYAYVYALELGHPATDTLHTALAAHGRV